MTTSARAMGSEAGEILVQGPHRPRIYLEQLVLVSLSFPPVRTRFLAGSWAKLSSRVGDAGSLASWGKWQPVSLPFPVPEGYKSSQINSLSKAEGRG